MGKRKMIDYEERMNLFKDIYVVLSPEDRFAEDILSRDSPQAYQFYSFLSWRDVMNQGYNSFFKQYRNVTPADLSSDATKAVWLFHEYPVENFITKLATFIIKNYDKSLFVSDYPFLFYISLQDVEFQKTLKGLPLPLIREALNPVVEENFSSWTKS
jgi:hypothetical protein